MTLGTKLDNNVDALGLTSRLASQNFPTADDALEAVLGVAQQIIQFQTVLISDISTAKSELRIHAVKNTEPVLTVPLGLEIPLTASPCQHVAGSVAPFVSVDMRADAELAILPAAKDLGASAYVGVPIVLADGSFFGTLVGLDTAAKEKSTENIQWMQILAQFAALQIDRQRTGPAKDEATT